MALRFSNQAATSGFFSISGKIRTNNMYGKLGENEIAQGLSGSVSGSLEGLGLVSNRPLQILYDNIGKDLEGLLTKYAVGDFDGIKDELTQRKVQELSRNIRNERLTDNPLHELYRVTFRNIIQGLQQTVFQYIDYLATIVDLEKCSEKSKILDDPEKLQEYINNLIQQQNRSFSVFKETKHNVISATLKPEYKIYIDLYGVPENLVFDPDKLEDIKNSLQ